MRLDKYWGTFGGIGGACLQESWNELRQMEINNQRREIEHQQKLEDDEFNLLLDHYNHERSLKGKALNVIDGLEEQLSSLFHKYNQLVAEHNSMATSLRLARAELENVKKTNTTLLTQKLEKERENIQLKKELEQLRAKHNLSVEQSQQTNEKIQHSFELSKRLQTNTEQTFTILQSKLTAERMEALMCAKLAYTQNLTLKRILAKQISLGLFNPSEYKIVEAMVIKGEDEKDMKRQGITYAESYDWIKTYAPERIETILGFAG